MITKEWGTTGDDCRKKAKGVKQIKNTMKQTNQLTMGVW